jgi:antitoxin MazE
MDTVIRKWGNSLAVRLPMSVINEAHFNPEQKVSIRAQDGLIIIEPVGKVEYTLDELVAGITAKNRHAEADFGAPVGKEIL